MREIATCHHSSNQSTRLPVQAPQHNADSWKRHWDKACELPNEIYIQARKRVQSNLSTGSKLAEWNDEDDHSGDEEEEGETDPEYEPSTSQTPSSTVKKAKKGPRVRKYRVTEADIQAMAHYIVEKRRCDEWRDLTGRLQWEEFAARPEVRSCFVASLQPMMNFAVRAEQEALTISMASDLNQTSAR